MPQTKLGNLDGYVRLAHADGGVLATVRSIVNIPRLLHDTIVGEVYLVDSFSGHEAQICGAALKLCCNIGDAVKRGTAEISVQLHVHALALCTPWKSNHCTLIRLGVL